MTRDKGAPASEGDPSLAALDADLLAELPAAPALNGVGCFAWDVASDRVVLDSSAHAVLGFDGAGGAHEFDGFMATIRERILKEELPGLLEQMEETFADSTSSRALGNYFRIRDPDGTIRWVHTQAAIRRDAAGKVIRAIGIVRAESEYAEEQALLESERERQADVVRSTTAALSEALSVDDVLNALTSHDILGPAGALGVSLTTLEQGRLRRLAAAGMPPEYLHNLEYGRTDALRPVAEVFKTQQPLFITRADMRERYPGLWPYIEGTRFTVSAVLPLIAQARMTGVLAVLYEDKKGFSPEERNLLVALAATVAQSLQRALLYDGEHAMAVGLQQAMLPAAIPAAKGLRVAVRYRPARVGHQIGGDWYDVIPLRSGKVGLVVGDVQGHDVQAAAVMGQLRTALRAYAAEGHSPATVMARASQFLHDLDTDRLATCIYVELDPANGHAQIIRAGHPCPMVKNGDQHSTRPSVAGGLPLGLPEYATGPYPATQLRLGVRDTLLLCTDGLLEFHGTDLGEGERQIHGLLDEGPTNIDQLAEHIVATIETRQVQEDDAALLLASLSTDGELRACP